MSEETIFAQAIHPKFLIMQQCMTRRSIIASVDFLASKPHDVKEHENKKWKIKYLGTNDYEVICKSSGQRYIVTAFVDFGYSVYKKKVSE